MFGAGSTNSSSLNALRSAAKQNPSPDRERQGYSDIGSLGKLFGFV